ncbi:MAG: septal ring lytic transglycosylase RlpA family protein [Acidiferrobacterales bacterium]
MKSFVLILIITLFLSACSSGRNPGGYFEDDGPQNNVKIDISKIPDATPRWERVDPSRSRPYTVLGNTYYPMAEARNYREIGVASWYGRKFHGRRTALGERYDMYAMTAAHKTLPLPTYVQVRNLKNNRTVVVRVNDRGPFLHKRLIDLSYAAAYKLNMLGAGTTEVEVTALTPGYEPAPSPDSGGASKTRVRAIEETVPLQAQEITATTGTSIYLQVGAFGSEENAEKLRDRLEQADFSPVLVLPYNSNDNQLYRVRIGPLDSIGTSETLRRRLADIGFTNTHTINE